MDKQEHLLTKIKGNVLPEHILFVDTETTQELRENGRLYHSLMLGVGIYARFRRDDKKDFKQLYRFDDKTQFWGYVQSKSLSKTVLYLISHNAVFDFTILNDLTKELSCLIEN